MNNECWNCGEPEHPQRKCFEYCSVCGALATGLSPDEADPSVGIFGGGSMCFICEGREVRRECSDQSLMVDYRFTAEELGFARMLLAIWGTPYLSI